MSTQQNKTFGLIKFGSSTYEVVPLQIDGSRIRVEFRRNETGVYKGVEDIFDQIKYIQMVTHSGSESTYGWAPLSKQKLKWIEAFYDILLCDQSRVCMSGIVMPSAAPPQQFYTK